MKLLKDRRPGAFFGMSIMLLLPVSLGVWAVTVNPWFMDEPLIFAAIVLVPCALIGGFFGALLARAWYSRTLLTLNLLGIGWIFFHPVPDGIDDVQLLVFGMDGASWDLVDKLETPNIDRLQETGSRSILESEDPMLSPLLWTTIATGQHPDAHQIRGFNTSADKIAVARFWDVAANDATEPRTVGLYKWLVSHPAEAGNSGGFVVPAWLAADTQTDPPELSIIKQIEFSNRLKRQNKAKKIPVWKIPLMAIPQGLRFSTLRLAGSLWAAEKIHRPGPLEKARDMQLLRVWMDRDFFLAQLHRNPTNIATFTTYATDALAHTHWRWMTDCHEMSTMTFSDDPEACPDWAQAIPQAYQQADKVLGQILDQVGWDTNIVVLSDHGFRAANEGDSGRYFIPLTSHLEEQIEAQVGPVLVQRLGKKLVVSLENIDLATQRAALTDYLENLIQQSTGEPLFKWEDMPHSVSTIGLTFRVEELDTARLGWDAVEDRVCWNRSGQQGCTANLSEYAEPDEPHAGEHHPDGIILASGRDVAHEIRSTPAQLVDVAPSLLTLIGLPASDDMVGEELWGNPLQRVPGVDYQHLAPLRFMDYTEPNNAMEEELEALGYIE